MFGQFKRKRGHYLALILIVTLLALPIGWIYQRVLRGLGPEAAALALTITIVIVLTFAIRGAIHASRLDGMLRGQVMALQNPPRPGTKIKPFEFKLFGLVIFRYPDTAFEFKVEENADGNEEYVLLPKTPNRTRIKQKNFPEARIRKAVLKWERRDQNFSARNLEEFLEQEFGDMDGVPSMATSTFYDHRTRILDEIKAKQLSAEEPETPST